MTAPRWLVDWPQVLVDVECSLCARHGRYRLARLAQRYGAAVPLARLLELIAADCTLMKPGEKPRHYEARCGIRYVVPSAGPLPADAPARAGAPRLPPPGNASRKRLSYDGPAPTLAMLRRHGIRAVSVTCQGLWRGHTCHRTACLALDRLGAPDDAVFLDLCRTVRLVCSRCGGRKMHIVPLWPDSRPVRRDEVAGPGMPGSDDRPAA